MYNIQTKANNILEIKYNCPAYITNDAMATALLDIEHTLLTAQLDAHKEAMRQYIKFGTQFNRSVDEILDDHEDISNDLILQIKRIMAMIIKNNSSENS